MALTERIHYDQYEIVTAFKHVQVRKATVIEKDGVELTRTFHRYVLTPDMDVSAEPDEIKGLCNVLWTDAVKAAWTKEVERQNAD